MTSWWMLKTLLPVRCCLQLRELRDDVTLRRHDLKAEGCIEQQFHV